MIELLVELCLRAEPASCARHLLPGACVESRAEDWIKGHPDLILRSWSCGKATDIAPLPVIEIAPGVFAHKGRHELPDARNAGDEANIGFIIGSESVAVIDAGGSRQIGEALYSAIRARTDLPISWVVLTHMHPDHVMGAAVFKEAGAQVIGHANLPAALINRSETYADALTRQVGPLIALDATLALPDATVTNSQVIDLGGRRLLLEAHPTAHTDNDLTVFDEATKIWWMGDLVFQEQTPSMDGSVLGWLRVLDGLTKRPAAGIVPGHGDVFLPWPEGAAPTRDYLSGLVSETRAALAKGESLTDASQTIGRDLRGNWLLFDDFNARNATAIYRELEWE